MSYRPLFLPALFALVSQACAHGVPVSEPPEPEQASRAIPDIEKMPHTAIQQDAGDDQELGSPESGSRQSQPWAMAATTEGLVLFDIATSQVIATAATTFPVTDIVFDPWNDRWAVVEYWDGGSNQVSIWRSVSAFGKPTYLTRETVLETGGYCRAVSTRDGLLVFEDDGLRQRWLATDRQLGSWKWALRTEAPSGVVVGESGSASQVLSMVARDDPAGMVVLLASRELDAYGLHAVGKVELSAWSNQASAPRLARATTDWMVAAQRQGDRLQVQLITEAGKPVQESVQARAATPEEVEDVAYDSNTDTAFVALSGSDRILALRVGQSAVPQWTALPSKVSLGSNWALRRLLGFDPLERVLLVGIDKHVLAYEVHWDERGAPRLIERWRQESWRQPVAIAELGAGDRK